MEFGLSQDQLLLQDSVKKFLSAEVPLDVVRGIAKGELTDQTAWEGITQMGLAGLLIPEAHGGVGLGMLDAVVVAEALG
ncbi:MAG: acyl-CoA dehydrogenase family protein, partial [Pseudomonadales bacterium]